MAVTLRIQGIIRDILTAALLIAAFAFLSLSSFAEAQFYETPKWKILAVSTIFIVLVSVFVFRPRIYDRILVKTYQLHFLLKASIHFCIVVFASCVLFLTKYPGFGIHNLEYNTTTSSSTTGESIIKYQFNLYAAGAFASVALISPCEIPSRSMEFGLFNLFLELTLDSSMIIPCQNGRGPNLWYMLGAGFYCYLLIVIRSYRESLIQTEGSNPAAVQPEQQHNRDKDIEVNTLFLLKEMNTLIPTSISTMHEADDNDGDKQDIVIEMNTLIPTSPRASIGRASISTTYEDDDDATSHHLETISVHGTNSVDGTNGIILNPRSIIKKDIGVQSDLPPGTCNIQEETVIVVEKCDAKFVG